MITQNSVVVVYFQCWATSMYCPLKNKPVLRHSISKTAWPLGVLVWAAMLTLPLAQLVGRSTSPTAHFTAAAAARSIQAEVAAASVPNFHNVWAGVFALDPISAGNPTGVQRVASNWQVPTVTCPFRDSQFVLWVGLGGINGPALYQTGIGVACSHSTPKYFAFWEVVPGYKIQVFGGTLSPNDRIVAGVSDLSGVAQLSVYDYGEDAILDWSAVKRVSDPSPSPTGECIVEPPVKLPNSVFTLADFGTLQVNQCVVNETPIYPGVHPPSPMSAETINMVNQQGATLVTSTANQVNPVWGGFSATWLAAR